MCILFGIGIRTNFRIVELSQFLRKSWHTPLRYMVCAAIANVSYSFQHRSFKLCRMFVHIMKMCISQNDTRQEIWYVGPTGSVGYICTIFRLIRYMLYTSFCGDSFYWTMGTFKQVCRKNHICRGPDETHTVDTVENRVICQDWFVITK
jgi:hypothetical protein